MDKSKRREEFPRPLPHPVFFGWATAICLVGVLYANLYFNGMSLGESILFWAVAILFAVGAIRGKWIR